VAFLIGGLFVVIFVNAWACVSAFRANIINWIFDKARHDDYRTF
jgi:hypothetical protein